VAAVYDSASIAMWVAVQQALCSRRDLRQRLRVAWARQSPATRWVARRSLVDHTHTLVWT